jgi:tetratricopeptide (TPR) repeat protein
LLHFSFQRFSVSAFYLQMRYLLAVFCALAIVVTQLLYGGAMRPVFALPGLFFVALTGCLAIVAILWKNIPSPSFGCVASVLAFAGWLIWREMESPDAWLAGGYLRLTLGCLGMYLLFAGVLTNPFHRLTFVGILFVAALVQAGAAALQFARPDTGPLIPWLSEQLRVWYAPKWNWRGHGTYLNSNHLVWFLNAGALMALSLTCWSRWGLKTKILCLYVALSCIAGAVVTLSRGGILAMGVGLASFLLLSAFTLAVGARDRRLVAVLVVAAIALAAVSVGLMIFRNSFLVQQRFDEIVTDAYRPAVFEAVLRQTQLQPVLGTGAGTFLYYGRAFREMNAFSDDVYAHNDWMQIAADFGLPALVLLLWVVAAHLGAGLRGLSETLRQRMSQYERPQSHAAALSLGALCCLLAFVVHSFFDFNMQIPANALLASALLGMLANPGMRLATRGLRVQGVFRRMVVLTAGAAGIGLLVLSYRSAPPEFRWLQAENALLQGRLGDARTEAELGLRAGPHSRLERTMGEIYLRAALNETALWERLRCAQLAAEHLERSLALAPADTICRLRLAEALQILGRHKAAMECLLEVIRKSPMQGRAYELYGSLLEEEGRLSEALRAYRVAGTLAGNVEARRKGDAVAKKLLILNP